MGQGDFNAVIEAAHLVGINDKIIQMPDTYDTVISGDTFGLSRSERKRIAFARAFYGKPRLIVLDEPSANLDAASRRVMESALTTLQQGGASIVVTQSIHSAQLSRMADHFLILSGKRHELTENTGQDTVRRARPSENYDMTGTDHTPQSTPSVDDNGPPFGRRLVLAGLGVMAVFFGTFYGWAASAPVEGAVVAPGVFNVDTSVRTIQYLGGQNHRGNIGARRRSGGTSADVDPASGHSARLEPE